jgi:hypothetical protein
MQMMDDGGLRFVGRNTRLRREARRGRLVYGVVKTPMLI